MIPKQIADDSSHTLIPTADIQLHDVVLGKGALCAGHVGTIAFKAIVESRLDVYLDVSSSSWKSEKTSLTLEVLEMVQITGGRFLRKGHQDNLNDWYELSKTDARVKVRDAFRDCVKNIRNKRKPSALLAKIGLSELFDNRSTYTEIVEHVVKSSNIKNYICSRNDMIEQRNQRRAAYSLKKRLKDKSAPSALTSTPIWNLSEPFVSSVAVAGVPSTINGMTTAAPIFQPRYQEHLGSHCALHQPMSSKQGETVFAVRSADNVVDPNITKMMESGMSAGFLLMSETANSSSIFSSRTLREEGMLESIFHSSTNGKIPSVTPVEDACWPLLVGATCPPAAKQAQIAHQRTHDATAWESSAKDARETKNETELRLEMTILLKDIDCMKSYDDDIENEDNLMLSEELNFPPSYYSSTDKYKKQEEREEQHDLFSVLSNDDDTINQALEEAIFFTDDDEGDEVLFNAATRCSSSISLTSSKHNFALDDHCDFRLPLSRFERDRDHTNNGSTDREDDVSSDEWLARSLRLLV